MDRVAGRGQRGWAEGLWSWSWACGHGEEGGLQGPLYPRQTVVLSPAVGAPVRMGEVRSWIQVVGQVGAAWDGGVRRSRERQTSER